MKAKVLAVTVALAVAGVTQAACQVGNLVRSYRMVRSGTAVQICIYDVNGDEISVIYSSSQACPPAPDFCS